MAIGSAAPQGIPVTVATKEVAAREVVGGWLPNMSWMYGRVGMVGCAAATKGLYGVLDEAFCLMLRMHGMIGLVQCKAWRLSLLELYVASMLDEAGGCGSMGSSRDLCVMTVFIWIRRLWEIYISTHGCTVRNHPNALCSCEC